MEIEELKNEDAPDANGEDAGPRGEWIKENQYEFVYLEKSLYKNIMDKETQTLWEKWGLTEKDMSLAKFRFNQSFNMFSLERFLKDLFNSPEVSKAIPGVASHFSSRVEEVEFEKLSTDVINMGFFDIIGDVNITTHTGYIKKEPDELLDGLQLGDRLRYALAFEESEYYTTFDDEMRKEFIFRVFQHIVLGGSIWQYEDNIKDYLTTTQLFYKDLMSVYKDSETNEIKVGSIILEIKKIDGTDIFSESHPQNWFYVIVDPIHWHVHIWYHKWQSWW